MRFAPSTLILYAVLTGMLIVALAPRTQAQQQDFSNEQLKSFAAAAEAVNTIAMKYGNRVQNAESQQEAVQLHEEAQSKMVNAVQDEGLSVETYTAIGQEAQGIQNLFSASGSCRVTERARSFAGKHQFGAQHGLLVPDGMLFLSSAQNGVSRRKGWQ